LLLLAALLRFSLGAQARCLLLAGVGCFA